MPRSPIQFIALVFFCALALSGRAAEQPNVIFILADDLGYGDLGSYGQRLIQTPHLDRMATEGMRFTKFYAGSTVCAPSRGVLMTGRHVGHATVRGNAGKVNAMAQTLRAEDVTIAAFLKKGGYATGLVGKWGLGELGSGGEPTRQGFDYFFGYLNQTHAHNYYPDFLTRNETRVPLKNEVPGKGPFGEGIATKKVEFSADLFANEALKWVEEKKDGPFFLYLALTAPHANNEAGRALKNGQEVPDLAPYADKDWTEPNKGQAALITRMDRDIGRVFELLKKLGLDEKTLVIFSSDNGPHKEGGNDPAFFHAGGGLRGIKRELYEGGIRVPFIARWPGRIAPGQVSKHVAYFGDVFATLSDVAGLPTPANLDSISFAPTLLGQADKQTKHEFLYWEFHEDGTKQAVLLGANWKGVRNSPGAKIELFDLATDLGETRDVAEDRPEITAVIEAYLRTARTESAEWPIRETQKKRPADPQPEN
ncbi:MAG: arylsulfatase [Chthoniobacteraceae bacterium]